MNRWRRSALLRFQAGLRFRLALLFGCLVCLSLLLALVAERYGVPLTSYRGSATIERENVIREMSSAADTRAERFSRWLDERVTDVRQLAQDAEVIEWARVLVSTTRQTGRNIPAEAMPRTHQYQALERRFRLVVDDYESCQRVLFAESSTGMVLVSTDPADLGRSYAGRQLFENAMRSGLRESVEIEPAEGKRSARLEVASVVRDRSDGVIGVVAMLIDPEVHLLPLLWSGARLGRTGSITLFDRSHRNLLPTSQAERTVPEEAAGLALRGMEGITIERGPVGREILAAYRLIQVDPGQAFGMVVSRELDEALTPLRQRTITMVTIALFLALVALIVTVIFADRIARPIRELSRIAHQAASGDLGTRAEASGGNEVGVLTESFNNMLSRIQSWHGDLEREVAARTKRLEEVNRDLSLEVAERRRVEQMLLQYQEQLRALASEVTLAEEQERRRLAMELHDQIGQRLAVSRIQLGMLRGTETEAAYTGPVQEVYALIGGVLERVQDLTFELSSPLLFSEGMDAALRDLGEHLVRGHGLAFELVSLGSGTDLPEDVRIIVYRAVRELLYNVLKHARATQVEITVHFAADGVTVSVEDDGIGFTPDQSTTRLEKRHFGLFSIRERVSYLGGRLEIDSGPGRGTVATIHLPLRGPGEGGAA